MDPDRPDLDFLDFEVSKKVKISAKKCFLQKILFFSWEALGSRYFVWRIVLGCGGVWGARNIVNLMKSMIFHGFDKDFAGSCPVFVQPTGELLYACALVCA